MRNLNLNPTRTVVTSFNPRTTSASTISTQTPTDEYYYEQGDWVLCVTGCHNQWISCALSNGEIQVYDQERLHCKQTYKLFNDNNNNSNHSMMMNHKRFMITDLAGDDCSSNPTTLLVSSTDGIVSLFDIRQQGQPTIQWKLPRPEEEALSVSLGYDGTLCAVGSNKAKIHFFDVRNAGGGGSNLLGTYAQSHTNEVTKVRFQTTTSSPSSSFGTISTTTSTTPMLVSAGEDGLACLFDTSQASEETALKNIYNVQSSIRQIGFFGPQMDAIYCLTGSESLQLYHMNSSQCRKDYGPNLRQYLSQSFCTDTSISNDPPVVSNTSDGTVRGIEYLVDCHWDIPRQELVLVGGNSNGNAGMYTVQESAINFMHKLDGGHRGVVRGFTSLSSDIFITVGEDARMCEWNRNATNRQQSQQQNQSKPLQKQQKLPLQKQQQHFTKRTGGGRGGPLRRKQRNKFSTPY